MNKNKIQQIIQSVGINTNYLEKKETWSKFSLENEYQFFINNTRSVRESLFLFLNNIDSQPMCKNPECDIIPNFISLSKGYNKYCCRSCGVICQTTDRSKIGKMGMVSKRKLASEDENYFKKSSPASKIYWLERGYTESETKEEISKFQKKFSLDICIEKYGVHEGTSVWQARQDKWQGTMNSKSCEEIRIINEKKNFYKNKTNFEKKEIERKKRETAERNGFWTSLNELEDFKRYSMKVWSITRKQQLSLLNGIEKRGHLSNTKQAYHLDHMFSIKEGFVRKILPQYIGDIRNLEMIPARKNCTKNSKCSITEDLLFQTFRRP